MYMYFDLTKIGPIEQYFAFLPLNKLLSANSFALQPAMESPSPSKKQIVLPQSQDQIEPLEFKPLSITWSDLKKNISIWDPIYRINQKFALWGLTFSLSELIGFFDRAFYEILIEYVCLKKLSILISDFEEEAAVSLSKKIKEGYQKAVLQAPKSIKSRQFDCLMIMGVKVVSYYLGSHTREVIIDSKLESEIYVILVHVILGNLVGEKVYSVVLDKYSHKSRYPNFLTQTVNYEISRVTHNAIHKNKQFSNYTNSSAGESQSLTTDVKIKITNTGTKKRIGRNEAKTGTGIFHLLEKERECSNAQNMDFGDLLHKNLTVREFVPKPKVKEHLDSVLGSIQAKNSKLSELLLTKEMENQMKHQKIFYTQLSNSLKLQFDVSLNQLKDHSIEIKPQKRSKYYRCVGINDVHQQTEKQRREREKKQKQLNFKTVKHIETGQQQATLHSKSSSVPELPGLSSYQAMVMKKKEGKYWKKIIEQMKENKYGEIESFPPNNAKGYFSKNMQNFLDNSNRPGVRFSEDSNCGHTDPNSEVSLKGGKKLVDQPFKSKLLKQFWEQNQVQSSKEKQDSQATQSELKTSEKTDVCSNTLDSADQGVYKKDRSFLQIYSNQPIEDIKEQSKLIKRSKKLLKEEFKNFKMDCVQRDCKAKYSMFSLPSIK